MAFRRSLAIFALVVAMAPAITLAMEYIVGDDQGWKVGVDYTNWAKDKKFVVGDSLVFRYPQDAHNVWKVNGTEFQSCTVPKNNSLGYFSGNDTIKLLAAGNKWYICGKPNHCQQGQKLSITVLESQGAPTNSAAILGAKEAIFKVFLGTIFAVAAMIMVN